MGIEAILREVDVLHGVSTSLLVLPTSTPLLRVAESIHNVAILLTVLVATKTG